MSAVLNCSSSFSDPGRASWFGSKPKVTKRPRFVTPYFAIDSLCFIIVICRRCKSHEFHRETRCHKTGSFCDFPLPVPPTQVQILNHKILAILLSKISLGYFGGGGGSRGPPPPVPAPPTHVQILNHKILAILLSKISLGFVWAAAAAALESRRRR